MLIFCARCLAQVEAAVVAAIPHYDHDLGGSVTGGYRIVLLQCSSCLEPVVGRQRLADYQQTGLNDVVQWANAEVLWPRVDSPDQPHLPVGTRLLLEECARCIEVGAATAGVLTANRVLQVLMAQLGFDGEQPWPATLPALEASELIDEQLQEWAEQVAPLSAMRPDSDRFPTSMADAENLYRFAAALCEYVSVRLKIRNRLGRHDDGIGELPMFGHTVPSETD